jgi:hypothetical protein
MKRDLNITELLRLEAEALDIAVAHTAIAAGATDIIVDDSGRAIVTYRDGGWEEFRPTVNWEHAGPIIERAELGMAPANSGGWLAHRAPVSGSVLQLFEGETPLIAAMRAYVASKT